MYIQMPSDDIQNKTYAGNFLPSLSDFLDFAARSAAKRSFRFKAAASKDPTSADIIIFSGNQGIESGI